MLRSVLFLVSFLFLTQVSAKAPFGLSVEEALSWKPESELAEPANVSRVKLAERFTHRASQLDPTRNPDVKVLIAPDGMDNFGNYIAEQEQFNLYNFTHWAQIDVLNWFAGTADQNINIPARPWVEAAHKNGVKVIGSVYLAVAQWGGSADTAQAFLVRDGEGRFPMAHKLVEIAEHYGFDGWLINQETDLSAVKDDDNALVKGVKDYNRAAFLGKEMLAFMTYLNHLAPEGMEIHWYDAQLTDGTVRWQNQLNDSNAPFLGHKYAPVSDAIFINYWWNESMVKASSAYANGLRRSQYDVYTGVDLWPQRNAQRAFSENRWLDDIFSDEQSQGLTSIALFANNFNFNFAGDDKQAAFSTFNSDPLDYQRFYETETRFFSGDNLNILDTSATGWKGLSHYIPARSVLSKMPFETHFNTGHGFRKMHKGQVVSEQPWHDMSQQDLLPSWQFAVFGVADVQVMFDFNSAYSGGNSLIVSGSTQKEAVTIPLYKTQLSFDKATLSVAMKGRAEGALALTFTDGSVSRFDLNADTTSWQEHRFNVTPVQGAKLERISLELEPEQQTLNLNIGRLSLE